MQRSGSETVSVHKLAGLAGLGIVGPEVQLCGRTRV